MRDRERVRKSGRERENTSFGFIGSVFSYLCRAATSVLLPNLVVVMSNGNDRVANLSKVSKVDDHHLHCQKFLSAMMMTCDTC